MSLSGLPVIGCVVCWSRVPKFRSIERREVGGYELGVYGGIGEDVVERPSHCGGGAAEQ